MRWIGLGLLLGLTASARAEDRAPQFLQALRARRLDQLLEAHCLRELARPDLTESQRWTLAVEFATLHALRATEIAEPKAREHEWQAADRLLAETLRQTTDTRQRASLRFQQALFEATRGQWLLEFEELQGHPTIGAGPIRVHLEAAVNGLRQLASDLEARPADKGARKANIEERAVVQSLAPLIVPVQYRLGATELALATTYPKDDPAANALVESAVARLEPLSRADALDEDSFPLVLALLHGYRRLGRFGQADELLHRLQTTEQPADTKDGLLAEQVEGLLEQGRSLDALKILYPAIKARPHAPAQWDYLYLRILLEQAQALKSEPTKASKLQASAFLQLRKLRDQQGGPWARRGELLVGKFATELLGTDRANRRWTAEILVRSREFAKAADLYRQAAAEAEKTGAADEAFALLYEAARAWEAAGDFAQASQSYEQLVARFPKQSGAAEALWRAIVNRRRAEQAQHAPADLQALITLIDRHRSLYPRDETAGEVLFLRGTLQRESQAFAPAIATFLTVPEHHRLRRPALLEASRTYERWLHPLGQSQTEPVELLATAITFHLSLAAGTAAGGSTLAPAEQAEVIIRLAKFLLDPRIHRASEAQAWLESWLKSGQTTHAGIVAAQRYLLLAHVLEEQFTEAETSAAAHAAAPANEILATFSVLQPVALSFSELKRRFLGQVEQKLLEPLVRRETELSTEQQFELSLGRSLAEIHRGSDADLNAAAERLAQLRHQRPRDARVREAAGLCAMRARRFDDAIAEWRALVAGLKEDTPAWYRAKLHLAMSLRRAGQPAQARKVIDVLEALYPQLGGPSLHKLFQDEKRALQAP